MFSITDGWPRGRADQSIRRTGRPGRSPPSSPLRRGVSPCPRCSSSLDAASRAAGPVRDHLVRPSGARPPPRRARQLLTRLLHADEEELRCAHPRVGPTHFYARPRTPPFLPAGPAHLVGAGPRLLCDPGRDLYSARRGRQTSTCAPPQGAGAFFTRSDALRSPDVSRRPPTCAERGLPARRPRPGVASPARSARLGPAARCSHAYTPAHPLADALYGSTPPTGRMRQRRCPRRSAPTPSRGILDARSPARAGDVLIGDPKQRLPFRGGDIVTYLAAAHHQTTHPPRTSGPTASSRPWAGCSVVPSFRPPDPVQGSPTGHRRCRAPHTSPSRVLQVRARPTSAGPVGCPPCSRSSRALAGRRRPPLLRRDLDGRPSSRAVAARHQCKPRAAHGPCTPSRSRGQTRVDRPAHRRRADLLACGAMSPPTAVITRRGALTDLLGYDGTASSDAPPATRSTP